jgi:hypothetical protein
MNKRDVASTIEALMPALISAPNPSFESKRSSAIKRDQVRSSAIKRDQVLNAPRARHP